ncbi:MAG: hypothetical protein HOL61_13680 [Rhodospirillaceae bacterium]|jgi:hypothetical protein|nr:hypothetical protein [Rhodospirillaceae bacterium]
MTLSRALAAFLTVGLLTSPALAGGKTNVTWTTPEPVHDTPSFIGDFDGDGTMDTAWLGVPAGSSGDDWQLIVSFDVANSGAVENLEHFTPSTPVEEVRITRAQPDLYTTFCGLVPGKCEPGRPASINLQTDGIFLEVLEASVVLIHWDQSAKAFARHWLSD